MKRTATGPFEPGGWGGISPSLLACAGFSVLPCLVGSLEFEVHQEGCVRNVLLFEVERDFRPVRDVRSVATHRLKKQGELG